MKSSLCSCFVRIHSWGKLCCLGYGGMHWCKMNCTDITIVICSGIVTIGLRLTLGVGINSAAGESGSLLVDLALNCAFGLILAGPLILGGKATKRTPTPLSSSEWLVILVESGATSSPKTGPPRVEGRTAGSRGRPGVVYGCRGFPRPTAVICSSWPPSLLSSTPESDNFRRSSRRCGSDASADPARPLSCVLPGRPAPSPQTADCS
jgi:hypothetical protein